MANRTAEIQFTKIGGRSIVEMSVPQGTSRVEAAKLHELVSRDLISKLSPRGCEACLSGVDVLIRERFENVLLVDLDAMKVLAK